MANPRTEILHIRLSEDEFARIRRAAESDFIKQSTWARRAILRALEQWEARKQRSGSERSPKRG
ncbi:MAG: hypothetical protein IRY91_12020 [Gemmatimonadaceae bacterium]|jgi:hypothetical protein|nr:hypothetical protein [Gemmatimonadaceae bacterium]